MPVRNRSFCEGASMEEGLTDAFCAYSSNELSKHEHSVLGLKAQGPLGEETSNLLGMSALYLRAYSWVPALYLRAYSWVPALYLRAYSWLSALYFKAYFRVAYLEHDLGTSPEE
ncbi:UNVERIFIED_CONTAM: hypothetical protein Slati_4084900 [Sesamum latifolium]|uniref:Uncharacterized protein n=1 Tax=Sesamum latifolium TaxID=2727402 RepID=A0AAW2T741_9LAMI